MRKECPDWDLQKGNTSHAGEVAIPIPRKNGCMNKSWPNDVRFTE